MQDLNEQLEETHNQTENEMREELDMKENTIREVCKIMINLFLRNTEVYLYETTCVVGLINFRRNVTLCSLNSHD